MPNERTRPVQPDATPDAPLNPGDPTRDRVPARRRGGHELPDDVQDRPEQNAGYDAAAHGETDAPAEETVAELAMDPADPHGDDRGIHVRDVPDELEGEQPTEDPDDRAERETVAEIRRRERRR